MIAVHGYTASGLIEATISGEKMFIPDTAGNYERRLVGEWEDDGNVIPPYVAPPPGPYRLYKSVFIRRMTEPEAATMEAVLAAADARLRLMFNSVEYFVSDDELFGTLVGAVGQALTPARATQLLAAE